MTSSLSLTRSQLTCKNCLHPSGTNGIDSQSCASPFATPRSIFIDAGAPDLRFSPATKPRGIRSPIGAGNARLELEGAQGLEPAD